MLPWRYIVVAGFALGSTAVYAEPDRLAHSASHINELVVSELSISVGALAVLLSSPPSMSYEACGAEAMGVKPEYIEELVAAGYIKKSNASFSDVIQIEMDPNEDPKVTEYIRKQMELQKNIKYIRIDVTQKGTALVNSLRASSASKSLVKRGSDCDKGELPM